jgi:glutamate mutase epsilon subunit
VRVAERLADARELSIQAVLEDAVRAVSHGPLINRSLE